MRRRRRSGRPEGKTALAPSPLIREPVVELDTADEFKQMGPGPCIHRLQLPAGHINSACREDCPGRQEQGVCLADVVRCANEQGIPLRFDVQPHPDVDPRWGGLWVWQGEPVEIIPREVAAELQVEPSTFVCPHCGHENTQDLSNFHFWCEKCGKNAKQLVD